MRFSPGLAGTDRPFDPFMLALPLVLLAGSRFGRGCRFTTQPPAPVLDETLAEAWAETVAPPLVEPVGFDISSAAAARTPSSGPAGKARSHPAPASPLTARPTAITPGSLLSIFMAKLLSFREM
jgi:hypothetical protein